MMKKIKLATIIANPANDDITKHQKSFLEFWKEASKNETDLQKLQKRYSAICLDGWKIQKVLMAMKEHWPIEKLIINVNDDMDILGGFIAASDEEILLGEFCSGVVG